MKNTRLKISRKFNTDTPIGVGTGSQPESYRSSSIQLPIYLENGDLVFDVGANLGVKTEEFLSYGTKVVCFEPQPNCLQVLNQKFSENPNVEVVPEGLSDVPGTLELSICSAAPTISTFSDEWKKGRFSDYDWDTKVQVKTTTLDQAIESYGVPEYIKIDVEGFELNVIKGLSKPVPFLSFEFTSEFIHHADEILAYLASIGYKHFNYAFGEDRFLTLTEFTSHSELINHLKNSVDDLLWGDIYAYYESKKTSEYIERESGDMNTYETLISKGLILENKPIKLHLGCGEQYFEGYINIDYPPSEHNVMNVRTDYQAVITELDFPDCSVDEIRLHHVFEHFPRVIALTLLIKWQKWLKIGGKLYIETPDFEGSAKTLLSDVPWKVKTGVIRHITGDQVASWAYHIDQWFPERFKRTFTQLGFGNVSVEATQWPHQPYLSNVHAVGFKEKIILEEALLSEAENILWESTVADEEKPVHEIWCKQLRKIYYSGSTEQIYPSNVLNESLKDIPKSLEPANSIISLAEIHDFNQRSRDLWIKGKAAQVAAGSLVLDIGAGTCPYRNLFDHCEYKTHDFKQYEGEKLGGGKDYGRIDYVSNIVNLPIETNSVDVVLCTEVLEHVPEPIEALKELIRIVKPNGRLLITAPLGSGLHQLPFHYYGGYSPEWYRYFCNKFECEINELVPNGGFFKLMAQESARIANFYGQNKQLHSTNAQEIFQLFLDKIPRFLFALEDQQFIDQFTVGYHVEITKKPPSIEVLLEALKETPKDVNNLLNVSEILFKESKKEEAKRYLLSAHCLNPTHPRVIELLELLS